MHLLAIEKFFPFDHTETVYMLRGTAKSRQKPPIQRTLHTPAPVQARVIARHINGHSNREIAAEEYLDRDTVSRILSQPEVARLRAQYQSRLLNMIPRAITVYEDALESDDERVRVAAATKLLEGFQVIPRGGVEQPPPQPDPQQQRLIVLGQMMEMMLTKHQRYGMPLPPGFAGLQEEAILQMEGASPSTIRRT